MKWILTTAILLFSTSTVLGANTVDNSAVIKIVVRKPIPTRVAGGTRHTEMIGTGFIVRDHFLVTCKHVSDGIGREYDAGGIKADLVHVLILDPKSSSNSILRDGVAVYRLRGKQKYKSLLVGPVPNLRERVSVIGYGYGKRNIKSGLVLSGDGKNLNDLGFVAEQGDSGGPVLNSSGEVVGILIATNGITHSTAIGRGRLFEAIEAAEKAPTTPRQVLKVLVSAACVPCEQFRKDAQLANLSVDVQFVTYDPALHGRGLSTPTFQLGESKRVGYSGLGSLREWIRATLRLPLSTGEALENLVTPGAALLPPEPDRLAPEESIEFAQADRPPAPSAEPVPEPAEELDPANLTIVILAAKQDVGLIRGVARKVALAKAIGPITRKATEVLGDKATVVIVAQRVDSDRFAAVVNASQVYPDPIEVLVLVRKQSLGLKGIIVKKVEQIIDGRVPEKLPIDVIFERVHAADFNNIQMALGTREDQGFTRGDAKAAVVTVPVEPKDDNKLKSMLGGLLHKVLNDREKDTPVVERKPDNSEERTGLLASLISLVGSAGVFRSWLKSRRENKAFKLAAGIVGSVVKARAS